MQDFKHLNEHPNPEIQELKLFLQLQFNLIHSRAPCGMMRESVLLTLQNQILWIQIWICVMKGHFQKMSLCNKWEAAYCKISLLRYLALRK